MPNTVLIGTAIAVISSVSTNACTVAGSVSVLQTWPMPLSKVRQQMIATGPIRTASR